MSACGRVRTFCVQARYTEQALDYWSGRRDSNSRPPAPHQYFHLVQRSSARFNWIQISYCIQDLTIMFTTSAAQHRSTLARNFAYIFAYITRPHVVFRKSNPSDKGNREGIRDCRRPRIWRAGKHDGASQFPIPFSLPGHATTDGSRDLPDDDSRGGARGPL